MSKPRTEALLVRLECFETEAKEEQGRSVQECGLYVEGTQQCWDETVCFPVRYTEGKKKIFPLPSGFKEVFASYLTDTLCFKRFKGNWLSLLPGYLGCFQGMALVNVTEGEILYCVS